MKKTAKQLAEELGVSATTVSLAFRGSPSISKATRERILAAAQAAGMTIPEPVTEKPPVVQRDYAMICSEFVAWISGLRASNPFVLNMIKDMGIASSRHGARLMTLFNLPEDLEQAPFDGFFIYNFRENEKLKQCSKPIIQIDRDVLGFHSVTFDGERSMRQLADWIEQKGYCRPYFLFIDHVHPKFKLNLWMLERLMQDKGIPMEIAFYNQDGAITGWDLDKEIDLIGQVTAKLVRRDVLPDLLICSNDCFAGMLQVELRKYGIQAGESDAPGVIPLVGYDDIPYVPEAGLFTTFRTDTAALSDAAVRLMNSLVDCPTAYKQHIHIETEMVIR